MSTVEIKKELHEIIDNGDAATIKGFYKMLKSYIAQRDADKKIAESESDIKAGKIVSHQEVKDMILNWKE